MQKKKNHKLRKHFVFTTRCNAKLWNSIVRLLCNSNWKVCVTMRTLSRSAFIYYFYTYIIWSQHYSFHMQIPHFLCKRKWTFKIRSLRASFVKTIRWMITVNFSIYLSCKRMAFTLFDSSLIKRLPWFYDNFYGIKRNSSECEWTLGA